jgi:hypothetical protein
MYRIQVWDESAKKYFDTHVVCDHLGPIGFKPATAEFPATEMADGVEALRASEDVGTAADVICCVQEVATGKRYFDESALPD